ncbi:Hypothetical predicted protein [Marmota monax]|uniref:Uncharacterized protein n=1 Tax=Marmota monax TaxID=9995 RepID=A0A5E4AR49_MARMO|nr:Hypothetical predicted protein [Marmota monax]
MIRYYLLLDEAKKHCWHPVLPASSGLCGFCGRLLPAPLPSSAQLLLPWASLVSRPGAQGDLPTLQLLTTSASGSIRPGQGLDFKCTSRADLGIITLEDIKGETQNMAGAHLGVESAEPRASRPRELPTVQWPAPSHSEGCGAECRKMKLLG